MFQIFVYKQVNNIAGVNVNIARYMSHQDTAYPSCGQDMEICHHILHCEEERRVSALNCIIDLLDNWLKKVGTDNSLTQCLVKYARMRGGSSMAHVARSKDARFEKLAQ